MRSTPGNVSGIIHENFSIIMAFAYSRIPLSKLCDDRFEGEWKYLNRSLFELAEIRADRALLEMGGLLRALDDVEELSAYFKETKSSPVFGKVTQGDGTETDLHFRDLTNKIVHAHSYTWDFANLDDPVVIFHSKDGTRWRQATMHLNALAVLMGMLMF